MQAARNQPHGNRVPARIVCAEACHAADAVFLRVARVHNAFRSRLDMTRLQRFTNLLRLVEGDPAGGSPVVWYSRAESDKPLRVHYRWNASVPPQDRLDARAAITVPATLPFAEMPGQQRVEILFGESPLALETLHAFAGTAAEGSTEVRLPRPNGFLRAAAYFEGQTVRGPLAGGPVKPPGNET